MLRDGSNQPINEKTYPEDNVRKSSTHLLGVLTALSLGFGVPASAAEGKLKIGLLLPLSGPFVVQGEQIRDGFQLALAKLGNRIGGVETSVLVIDDENKPDVAARKAQELAEREKVNFVVGPVSVAILQAIRRPVLESGAILVSPNSGPSIYAGAECRRNFFVTSYQNDQIFEAMGRYAQDTGYKSVFLLVPNYQAGKDAVAGFKRAFHGTIVGEAYTPVGNTDFSAELAQIAAFHPDAIYTFMPGGMGVNLAKQYRQAGLQDIPFLSSLTIDETTLPAQQDAAVGLLSASNWTPDLAVPANSEFVRAYLTKTGSLPANYAMQGYDTAMLLDAAVRGVGGRSDDRKALIGELEKAQFTSLRGQFRFGANHYPIQNFYLARAAKRQDGRYETKVIKTIFENYQDRYVGDCKMTE